MKDQLIEKINEAIDTLNSVFINTHINDYKITDNKVIFLEDGKEAFKYTIDQILNEEF